MGDDLTSGALPTVIGATSCEESLDGTLDGELVDSTATGRNGGQCIPDAVKDGPRHADARARFNGASWLLCAVAMVEGADQQLLPATLHALEVDLGLSPAGLGTMFLAQSLLQATTAPVWGFFADRYSRKWLLVVSCIAWGALTAALAFVHSVQTMVLLRCFHGATLASLHPIAQTFVADIVEPSQRGAIFGRLASAAHVGAITASYVGVSVANQTMAAGVRGWRVLFFVVALISFAFAFLLARCMVEPTREGEHLHREPARSGHTDTRCGHLRYVCFGEIHRVAGYFKNPTFLFLLAQGMFGSVPWNALGFLPLYLVHCGHSDSTAAWVTTLGLVGAACGVILGGKFGDALARCSSAHGRPCTAQISVTSGLPTTAALVLWAPSASGPILGILALLIGLTSTWCGVAVKLPILTEIVDPTGRASIIAWMSSLEGSSAALFGAPVVGWLAEDMFGYDRDAKGEAALKQNVDALSSALLCGTIPPWLICFVFFTLLHFTYAKDVARQQAYAAFENEAPDLDFGQCDGPDPKDLNASFDLFAMDVNRDAT